MLTQVIYSLDFFIVSDDAGFDQIECVDKKER